MNVFLHADDGTFSGELHQFRVPREPRDAEERALVLAAIAATAAALGVQVLSLTLEPAAPPHNRRP